MDALRNALTDLDNETRLQLAQQREIRHKNLKTMLVQDIISDKGETKKHDLSTNKVTKKGQVHAGDGEVAVMSLEAIDTNEEDAYENFEQNMKSVDKNHLEKEKSMTSNTNMSEYADTTMQHLLHALCVACKYVRPRCAELLLSSLGNNARGLSTLYHSCLVEFFCFLATNIF